MWLGFKVRSDNVQKRDTISNTNQTDFAKEIQENVPEIPISSIQKTFLKVTNLY